MTRREQAVQSTGASSAGSVGQRGFVLVHGGEVGAWCWERLAPRLALPSIALELRAPAGVFGGGVDPRLTLGDYLGNAVRQVEAAGLGEAVVVGHSLGGVTAVALSAQRPDLVGHLVLISCAVAVPGRSVVSAITRPFGTFASWWYGTSLRTRHLLPVPRLGARFFYCHGLTRADRDLVFGRRVGEPPRLLLDPVPDQGVHPDLPVTWVRLGRDWGIPPVLQDRMRANLGRPCEVVELDAPHMVMLSDPDLLAAALNGIAAGTTGP